MMPTQNAARLTSGHTSGSSAGATKAILGGEHAMDGRRFYVWGT